MSTNRTIVSISLSPSELKDLDRWRKELKFGRTVFFRELLKTYGEYRKEAQEVKPPKVKKEKVVKVKPEKIEPPQETESFLDDFFGV